MGVQQSKRNNPWLRLRQAREAGQSIPLIALMIVLLIGMVALSVDVGNRHAEQRELIRVTEAAAIAGMKVYMDGGDDIATYDAIVRAFRDNGLTVVTHTDELAPDERRITAHYLDMSGNVMGDANCLVGECNIAGAAYIQIQTEANVDTYFARVVGQDTLPIASQEFAGRCPPINGVMPFAVNHAIIDSTTEQFKPIETDGTISMTDLGFTESLPATFKKLYLGDPNEENLTTADMGLLRWKESYASGNWQAVSDDMHDMLEGEGIRKLGFEEVTPWPGDPNKEENHYPKEPGYLTEGDWVYGIKYSENGGKALTDADVQARLDEHIQNRTRLIIPLYDTAVPSVAADGDRPSYHIDQFGEFYLLDYDKDNLPHTVEWLEMVFVGYAPRIPCSAENVHQLDRFAVRGNVNLIPRWAEKPDEWRPAGFTIMLDVSGSMNLSFDGWGRFEGRDYQCEAKDPAYPTVSFSFEVQHWPGGNCAGGTPPDGKPWFPLDERRAFASRAAILKLVEKMTLDEAIRVVAFDSKPDEVHNKWYNKSDPDLTLDVQTIGENCSCGSTPLPCDSPCYYTTGGTSGSWALQVAWAVMKGQGFSHDGTTYADAIDFPTYFNNQTGQDEILRRVAIYMTDGVSNKLFPSGSRTRPECWGLTGGERTNTAWCQLGYDDQGRPRPITQMRDFSRAMHQEFATLAESDPSYEDFAFYVIAMGRTDTTGLDEVSTHPSMMYQAKDKDELNAMLEAIYADASSSCARQQGPIATWIDDARKPSTTFTTTQEWYGSQVFGYLTISRDGVDHFITGPNGQPTNRIPIFNNYSTGRLGFYIPKGEGLGPGTYTISNVVVFFKPNPAGDWEEDVEAYTEIRVYGEEKETITFTITAGDILGDTAITPDMTLDINSTANEKLCEGL